MIDFSFLFFYEFDLIFHFVKIDDKEIFFKKYFCKVQIFF